jgi:amino acid adenylation domain-containing protein
MIALDARIENLSIEKRKLLALLRKKKEAKSDPAFSMISNEDRALLPPNAEDAYPLGTVQLGMLFHMLQESDADTPADYHNVASFKLKLNHSFDLDVFQQSVDDVVANSPGLRTSFDLTSFSEPLQIVHQSAVLPVQHIDWRHYCEQQQAQEMSIFINDENFNLMDIAQAPLMKLIVHQMADNIISLTLTEPHSIADGWSTHLTLIDIFDLYFAKVEQREFNLPVIAGKYSDFIKAERETLNSEKAIAFWEEKISQCVVTELPRLPQYENANNAGIDAHKESFVLSRDIVNGLHLLAEKAKVPVKAVLLAAHFRLLSLITGQSTVTSGLNFNGRMETVDGTKVRGLFLNMLPVTLSLSGGSWIELVQQSHQAELEILPYRRFPLGALQSKYGKKNLFDTAVSFLHFHSLANAESLNNGRIEHLGTIDHSKTNYDFNAVFSLNPDDKNDLFYIGDANLDILSPEQVSAFLRYYRNILEDMAYHCESDYLRKSFLDEDEQNHLIYGVNNTEKYYPSQIAVHQLFEQQVAKNPDAVALKLPNGECTSYETLNQRANVLAQTILSEGFLSGTYVGVYHSRSIEMVVAILAVLKAGLSYIPFDRSAPSQRVKQICGAANIKLLLTDTDEVIVEDMLQYKVADRSFASSSALNPNVTVSPEQTAYVLYTSGSTGLPKGVMVKHKGLTNYLSWANRSYIQGEYVCMPLYTSISFDLTITTLFTPLISGNQILIYDEQAPATLLNTIVSDNQVDLIKMTPAHMALLKNTDLQSWKVKRMIVGGEALSSDLCVSISDKAMMPVKIYNEYGPTETVVGCSVHCFDAEKDLSSTVSIGAAADNVQMYVLDEHLNPLPVGVKGELYIAGDGVSLGYLNDQEKTEASFIHNPFAQGKMYKTGDLVRWLPQDALEYLDRADNQVKIRGYRIEPGEIESLLTDLTGISESLVLVRGEHTDKQLVAYVIPSDNNDLESLERKVDLIDCCREQLSKSLPNYMIPSAYIMVEKWPLTHNGKVDRQKLPPPDALSLKQSRYLAPRNEVEQRLCIIWQDTLGVDKIGIEDNFFELGGHSIMALQLIANIQDEFDLPLAMNQFLDTATIKGVASQLQEGGAIVLEAFPLVVENKEERAKAFPLTDVQQAYLMGRSDAFELGNISTHVYIEANLSNLDVDKFSLAWNKLLKRHEMLRAVFSMDGFQRILADVPEYNILYNDLSTLSSEQKGEQLDACRDEMSHQIISIDQWPLFDLRISRYDDNKYRVHFSMDALLADAQSIDIINVEMNQLYADLDVELAPLSLSFRDYILAEQSIRDTQRYQISKDYWIARLNKLPMAPELPLSIEPSEIKKPYFERRIFKLSAPLWQQLKQRAQTIGVTPTILMLSLFAMTINRWSKQSSFTLNLTLFNRLPLHDQVNEIIGDFTSLTLLAIDFDDSQKISNNAATIQKQLWDDLEHRYFGGTEVLRALNQQSGNVQAVGMPVVFSSTLGMGNTDSESQVPDGSDTVVEDAFSITQTSQVWLDHQLSEQMGELVLTWDAIEELFPENLLNDMFTAYTELVTSVAADAGGAAQLARLPIPVKQQALRTRVNNTTVPRPEASSDLALLQGTFIRQVQQAPEAVALIHGEHRLTYAVIDNMANIMAANLVDEGIHSGEVVAVVMAKGWQQIVAVYAILYSGAAYIPIDATLPDKRIAQILEQAEAKFVLTQPQFADEPQWLTDQMLFIVDNDLLQAKKADSVMVDTKNTDLAYVIFTSGSTGKPKGVMIDHRGAVNTILDINERFSVTNEDRVLGVSALNFDLSVYDIFGILGAGGTLVLPDSDSDKDPSHWLDLVNREKITLWNTVPALSQLLFEESERRGYTEADSIRLVMMSGDWIPLEVPELIKRCSEGSEVFSLGGATEASIWSIYYPIDHVEANWKSIPYGKPMENQQFFVLDHNLELRPSWAVGDLYIGGIGVALGYWKDDIRTQASFISHPVTGERLYKTGDLGRYLPCGNIEFLGREDNQVKINGHRIELGEIEAQLNRHEGVKTSVVTTVGEKKNNRRLVAYIVPQQNQQPKVVEETNLVTVLEDKNERAVFKFMQHGLRDFTDDFQAISLPVDHQEDIQLSMDRMVLADLLTQNSEANNAETSPIDINKFGNWLNCLSQVAMEGYPIPKRFYPSSGSLYPVQTYMLVKPGAIESLAGGSYYYCPTNHELVLVTPLSNIEEYQSLLEHVGNNDINANFVVFFVGERRAMVPMYGDLTERFCRLEAGHMAQLLASSGLTQGIGLSAFHYGRPEKLEDALMLSDQHQLIYSFSGRSGAKSTDTQTLNYLQRQSYREFETVQIAAKEFFQWFDLIEDSSIRVLLYIKEGRIESFAGGFYEYHPTDKKFSLLIDLSGITDLVIHGNQPVEQNSAFSVYFVGSTENSTYLATGYIGQQLTNYAPSIDMGMCAIGNLDFSTIAAFLQLPQDQKLLVSYEGGRIHPQQMSSWPLTSAPKTKSQVEVVKAYLEQCLPYYMVPAVFIPIEKIPLTDNGKINRKALPELDSLEDQAKEYIAPASEIEIRLAEIWMKLLDIEKVSTNDNFFELGGHSLLLIQLVAQLNGEFGTNLTLAQVFSFNTMADFSLDLEKQLKNDSKQAGTHVKQVNEQNDDEREILEL